MFEYKYEIKKSKFYSFIFKIKNLDDFNHHLELISNQFKKFDHLCYLYKFINENNQQVMKFNEANEPKGSVGYPLINLINQHKLNNIGIIIIRKFGGIKLGIGLLTRSYLYGINELIKQHFNELID